MVQFLEKTKNIVFFLVQFTDKLVLLHDIISAQNVFFFHMIIRRIILANTHMLNHSLQSSLLSLWFLTIILFWNPCLSLFLLTFSSPIVYCLFANDFTWDLSISLISFSWSPWNSVSFAKLKVSFGNKFAIYWPSKHPRREAGQATREGKLQ